MYSYSSPIILAYSSSTENDTENVIKPRYPSTIIKKKTKVSEDSETTKAKVRKVVKEDWKDPQAEWEELKSNETVRFLPLIPVHISTRPPRAVSNLQLFALRLGK